MLQIVLALVISGLVFEYLINNEEQSFETLALGTQTSTYQAKNVNGDIFHFLHIDSTEQRAFLTYKAQLKDSILCFLGNSQSHSINQLQKADKNFIQLVAETSTLKPLAFSFPNANLQEHLVTLDYLYSNVKIKKLVLPIFMDDLREDGVREAFFASLYSNNYKLDATSKIANDLTKTLAASPVISNDSTNIKPTTQEKTEAFLNQYLAAKTSIWPKREVMRGNLFNWLYMLRNTVFGIRPSSVRNMITEQYQRNFEALKSILDITKANGTFVYVYIPPIRSDVSLPYDKNEYTQFKKDLRGLVRQYSNARIKDFSKIISGKHWGYKEATNFIDKREVDYMHFQFKGHQILADSLIKFIQ